MTSPSGKPNPSSWKRAYAQVQLVADADIITALNDAQRRVSMEMNRILSSGTSGVGTAIRLEQMARIRRALLVQQAEVFRRTGNITQARRLEAAARAVSLGSDLDAYLLGTAGRGQDAEVLRRALTRGLERTTEVALARMGYSYTDLSTRIYKTNLWMSGRLDTLINSALAQGLTAAQFAAVAQDWFSPNTPGGIRYAALRLARSEINNAYHAVQVQQANEKPWVNAMQWHLSSSHPRADECDALAHEDHFKLGPGKFPKAEVPRKPHPHCFCYVVPATVDEEDFFDTLLSGGYDDYINRKRASLNAPAPPAPKMPPARQVKPKPPTPQERAVQHVRTSMRIPSFATSDAHAHATRVAIREEFERQATLIPHTIRRLGNIEGDVRSSRYGQDWMRTQSASTGAFYQSGTRGVHFSPSWFDRSAAQSMQTSFVRHPDVPGWFSISEEASSLRSTVAHELGHHVEAMASGTASLVGWTPTNFRSYFRVLQAEFGPLAPLRIPQGTRVVDWRVIDSWFQQNKFRLGQVSQYGATNFFEFNAEVWAEFSTSPTRARARIVRIGQALQKLAEAGSR